MGMFDDLIYEAAMPLPDGYQGRNFQTKDFRCDWATYRISAEGRVMQPLNENDEIAGMLASTGVVRWRDVQFHGWLNFYTLANTNPDYNYVGGDNPGEWHGYNAKFTDGQLVMIEMDKRTAESHAARNEPISTKGD